MFTTPQVGCGIGLLYQLMMLVLIAGSWAAAVVEELEQMPQDIRVDKYRMSGYTA